MLTIVKLLVSAGLIYLVNEIVVVRSKPLFGAMIASLPLVSLITFVWIYYAMAGGPPGERTERLAAHSEGVFWFVLPSLPMFLVFPFLLRRGLSFWTSLMVCAGITMLILVAIYSILKANGREL